MNQTITINIIDPASGQPGAGGGQSAGELPGGGLVSADLPQLGTVSDWFTEHSLALILAVALFVVVAVVLLVKSNPAHSALRFKTEAPSFKNTVLGIMPFLILVPALVLTSSYFYSTANAAAQLQLNGGNLNIDITKGVDPGGTTSGSTTVTATVTTSNATGYELTATIDTTSLQTLVDNAIVLTLTGGDISDLPLQSQTADVPVELLDTNAPATAEGTNFTLAASVPNSITAGHYSIAVYYAATDNAPSQPTTMQDATLPAFCTNGMSVYPDTSNGPNTIVLTDIRNSQNYRVRKLPDNKCWMIDNLKLGSTSAPTPLTPADTNITSNWTLPQVYSSTSQISATTPYAYNPVIPLGACLDSGASSAYTDDSLTGCGYLYNWSAAVASSGSASRSQSGNDLTTDGNTAQQSICPTGWHLPRAYSGTAESSTDTSYGFGELAILNSSMAANAYTTPGVNSYPSNWDKYGMWEGTWAGYFGEFNNITTYHAQATRGDYWSSSIYNSSYAISYGSGYGYTTLINRVYSSYGLAVRCVL